MATTRNAAEGILADENREKRDAIIELLSKAYWMEIETVMSYMANSINPDGVRAQEIIEALEGDIQEELGHARKFAERILLEAPQTDSTRLAWAFRQVLSRNPQPPECVPSGA